MNSQFVGELYNVKEPFDPQEKETISDWVEGTKGREDNGSIGRCLDVVLLGVQEDDGGRDGSGGTQVGSGIEVRVDPLVCKGGVDDRFRGFQDLPGVSGVNLGIKGETLTWIAPAPAATMKMATREKCWGVGGQKGRRCQ